MEIYSVQQPSVPACISSSFISVIVMVLAGNKTLRIDGQFVKQAATSFSF